MPVQVRASALGAATALLVIAAGCKTAPDANPVGAWQVDVDQTGYDPTTAIMQAASKEAFFQFKKDGTFTMMGTYADGKWHAAGNTITLTFEHNVKIIQAMHALAGGTNDQTEMQYSPKDDSIGWDIQNPRMQQEQTLKLKRVKGDSP